jgi:hypothetical protein
LARQAYAHVADLDASQHENDDPSIAEIDLAPDAAYIEAA